jgi:hypothetical protein
MRLKPFINGGIDAWAKPMDGIRQIPIPAILEEDIAPHHQMIGKTSIH